MISQSQILTNQKPGTTELVAPALTGSVLLGLSNKGLPMWKPLSSLKGDIPNENFRLPPLEVHFEVGGCGYTNSAGGWSRIR